MDTLNNRKFWFGTFMAAAGIVLLFVGMLIEPQGEISGSVLGAAGEIFLLSGAAIGLDSYVNVKVRRMLEDNTNTDKSTE